MSCSPALPILLALCAGVSACAGSRSEPVRESVSTAEWLVDAPLARVAGAFEAVRDSLGIVPLTDVPPGATAASGTRLALGGHLRGVRVAVDLAGEGTSTRLHLRMEAPGPSASMEHLRWASVAVAGLGAETRAVNVPAAIWPRADTTCLGRSPLVGTPEQGWRAPGLTGGREPVYGPAARRAGVEGRILVRIAVDGGGAVECAEVMSGLAHGLSQSTVDAARTWRFRPATRNGARTAATFVTSVAFPVAPSLPMPHLPSPPICPREDPNCRI